MGDVTTRIDKIMVILDFFYTVQQIFLDRIWKYKTVVIGGNYDLQDNHGQD